MGSSVIIFGPDGAGKSPVDTLLAQSLGLKLCLLRDVNSKYFRENGFEDRVYERLWKEEGFEAYALERGLAEHPNSVVVAEPTQHVYEDKALLAHVKNLLQPYKHIVLLLPSPDVTESVRIIEERHRVVVMCA